MMSSLRLMVIVAPLECMMLVVSVDALDVADVLPIGFDVDVASSATSRCSSCEESTCECGDVLCSRLYHVNAN